MNREQLIHRIDQALGAREAYLNLWLMSDQDTMAERVAAEWHKEAVEYHRRLLDQLFSME